LTVIIPIIDSDSARITGKQAANLQANCSDISSLKIPNGINLPQASAAIK